MKKWIFLFLTLAAIGGGWWGVRTYVRVTPPGDEPKIEKITRGDIRVPITAAGLIEPNERIEIKPEASGEVLEVRVREGNLVKEGDVLVVIKREDEERNVEKAEANTKRANALLKQAEISIERAKANVLTADARVAELTANKERLADDLRKVKQMSYTDAASERELLIAQTSLDMNTAQLAGAVAQVTIAKHAVADAEQTVKLQEAAVSDATSTLKDARTRLSRTEVKSKRSAVITEVRAKVGAVVQSATAGLTGGSILLTMADVSKLKVITRVDEADYGRVMNMAPAIAWPELPLMRAAMERVAKQTASEIEQRSGEVTITVDAYPEKVFKGRVERVEPQGKLNAGASIIQFDVHVLIDDDDRHVLPLGTQAQVEFTVESVKNVLMVPADAVKQLQGEKGVYVKSGEARDSKPRFVKCRFGITDSANTHLIAALGGDELVEGTEVYTKLPVDREKDKAK